MDIVALLSCLVPSLNATTVGQMGRIAQAMLGMTGRGTLLGLSRWAEEGGSYRSIQRFFSTPIAWGLAFWLFFAQHLYQPGGVYLLVGDEVVVTKAGKKTYGLDRFYSSLAGKAVPGLSFLCLALVNVEERRAYPMQVEQIVRTETDQAANPAKTPAQPTLKRGPGRPKGSRNGNKVVVLTPELQLLQRMIQRVRGLIGERIALRYLVLDGHFGNRNALHVARQSGLQLISKLRYDAALYLPYDGPYAGRGPHRKYGPRLDYRHLPEQFLKRRSVEGGIRTDVYQASLLHKDFPTPLNVVIVVKTTLRTGAQARVVLFSSDLSLPYEQLLDFYALRFQIEFAFRDGKQFWGLEDFMNVSQTAVTNAANLALFMVNLSAALLRQFRRLWPEASLLDLKAHYRASKYVQETLNCLPETPDPVLLSLILERVTQLGAVHAPPTSP